MKNVHNVNKNKLLFDKGEDFGACLIVVMHTLFMQN